MKTKKRRSGVITKIIIAVLIVYMAVSLVTLCGRISRAKSAKEDISRQIADVTAENAEMDYAIKNKDEADVKESIARDKLGMVDPDEQIYYNQ